MRKCLTLFLLMVILSANLSAQKRKGIPPQKPKLVIGIVVEQMRNDYISRYWDRFEEGGFKRLIIEGSYCKNTHYNYMLTQTGVGHATITSGTNPSHHGIISSDWYVRLKDKMVYCVADEEFQTVGSGSDAGKMSPRNLQVSTVGDELCLSNNHRSKIISISLRDCSAILGGGHAANGAYWFDNENGKWITSSYYMNDLPIWVTVFNNKKFPALYLEREWNTLQPIENYKESLPDQNNYEIGFYKTKQTTFPYDLKQISRKGENISILRESPYSNTLTKDFAIAAIANEELGVDDDTDFLMVSFSATDYIGEKFGAMSVEVEDTYLRLNNDLKHFLDFIDVQVGKENVLIFLTSDHGTAYSPQYLADMKIPGENFNPYPAMQLLRSYLKALYGHGDWVKTYEEQQIYLNRNLIEDTKLSLADVQTKVAEFMIQFSGVSNAVTATTLQTTNFNEGIFQKMQNSYNQKFSGDVIINLSPGWIQREGRASDESRLVSHNSAYTYDTHVPLVWYGWKIRRGVVARKIDICDIAPTLSTFLEVAYPNACTGELIFELIDQ